LPENVLPGFREACLAFYWKCYEIEKSILRALALGLRLEEEWFLQYHQKVDSQMRLLHYPSISQESIRSNKLTRISAHSDFDTFTFLFQDNVGGLEAEDPNEPGKFHAVTPVPNSIVVNAGDFLQRWSNDTILSTMHRVRAPQNLDPGLVEEDGMIPERYSIPYFCVADLDTIVDSIPGTWSADHPKKYDPVSSKEYIIKRIAANY